MPGTQCTESLAFACSEPGARCIYAGVKSFRFYYTFLITCSEHTKVADLHFSAFPKPRSKYWHYKCHLTHQKRFSQTLTTWTILLFHSWPPSEHLGNRISSWKRAADGVVIFFPTTSSTFVSSSDTAFESPSSFLWHKSLQVPPEMPRFSFPSPSGPCPWLHAPSSTSSKPRRVLVGGHETAATTPHRGKSFATPYVIIYHRWIFHGGRKKKPALKQIVIIGDNCPLWPCSPFVSLSEVSEKYFCAS